MTDEQKEEFVENYRNTEVVVPEYETEEYALMDEEEGEVDDGDDEMEEEVEVLDVNADGEIENDFPDYMNDADTSTFA